jgi:hypothetical protein
MLGTDGHVRYNQINQMLGLEGFQGRWKSCRSPPHAWDYCCKEDTRIPGAVPHEWGDRPKERWLKKAETELAKVDRISEIIKRKGSTMEVYESDDRAFAYRNPKMIKQMKSNFQKPSKEFLPKTIYWLKGKSRSKKTYIARKFFLDNEIEFWEPSSGTTGQWWDEYDNEPGILIEELRRFTSIALLLRILDGFEIKCQEKGSNVVIRARVIIITSEYGPEEIKLYDCEQAEKPGVPALLTPSEQFQITRRINMPPELMDGDPPDKWKDFRVGEIRKLRNPTEFERRQGINNPNPLIQNLSNPERKFLGLPELPVDKMNILRPDLVAQEQQNIIRRQMREEAREYWRDELARFFSRRRRGAPDENLEREHLERLERIQPEEEPEGEDVDEAELRRQDREMDRHEGLLREWLETQAQEDHISANASPSSDT